MIAVIINCAAIVIGSLAGLLLSRKITEHLSSVIRCGAGIATLIIGLQMAFSYQNVIYLIFSLIAGGIIGSWLDLDGKILIFGRLLERIFYRRAVRSSDGTVRPGFAYAFLNSSVLFCVGAMAIVGSFQAGVEKNYTLLLTKSVLDGFPAIGFAAASGPCTVFSVIPVFLYQGCLTLVSSFVRDSISAQMLAEITGVGGALIVMIGINLLDIKDMKTANYLPAVVLVVLFVLADPYISRIASMTGL